MAMSKSVSMGSLVIGCILLVLTVISVICGGVVTSKLTSEAGFSIGFWALYFVFPGVLSIIAGVKKNAGVLVAALVTHILGIILAIAGLWVGAVLWAILSATCSEYSVVNSVDIHHRVFNQNFGKDGNCYCVYGLTEYEFSSSCSDLDAVRAGVAAVTIIFAIFAIVTLIGSIYGCIGTCCAQREPGVIVTTAQPGTVIMTTQTYPGSMQQPPPYGQGQMDTKVQF